MMTIAEISRNEAPVRVPGAREINDYQLFEETLPSIVGNDLSDTVSIIDNPGRVVTAEEMAGLALYKIYSRLLPSRIQ
ncbi:MAG: hypothetical protein V4702_03795 [Patescibacteria group bacterium]